MMNWQPLLVALVGAFVAFLLGGFGWWFVHFHMHPIIRFQDFRRQLRLIIYGPDYDALRDLVR